MGKNKKILLAEPRGFCSGVRASLKTLEEALAKHGPPIYVKHEIVHNSHVLADLRSRGVVFVEEMEAIPRGGIFVINAHGVPPEIENKAKELDLTVIDATCPVVKNIQKKARKLSKDGFTIIIIGHASHPEVIGVKGYIEGKSHTVSTLSEVKNLNLEANSKIAIITQTTLDRRKVEELLAALQSRFSNIPMTFSSDVCRATIERQEAVMRIAPECDLFLVVGSANSSNSNRLREIASQYCPKSYLVEDWTAIQDSMLETANTIGISAGASAPEKLVEEILHFLCQKGFSKGQYSTSDCGIRSQSRNIYV